MPPRRLPWLNNNGGAGKVKVNEPPKPGKKNIYKGLDSDDDFFEGTILASSRKGKERADPPKSNDDLPELTTTTSRIGRGMGRGKGRQRSERALSSSPPPISELPPPQTEYMRKAVDKFNLRDDEWMMVEDEFLQTAKLFTRHLHLAEYELLKENIQKKKEEIARPTVAAANPSEELQIQMRIEAQTKKQKKMLADIFSSSDKDDIDDYLGPSRLATSDSSRRKPLPSSVSGTKSHSTKMHTSNPVNPTFDSDSDDLDAPKPPPRPSQSTISSSTTAFAKSDPPLKSRASRIPYSRATPFDLLDELAPKRPYSPTKSTQPSNARSSLPIKPTQTQTSRRRSPSPTKPSRASSHASTGRPRRPFNLFDELDTPSLAPSVSKEQVDRFAKRKADRDKEREREKRKSVKLDDIPTFLF